MRMKRGVEEEMVSDLIEFGLELILNIGSTAKLLFYT